MYASKDSHDDDFFFENSPRYDSPILEASEKTEMESVAGWKLAEIYDENALLHKDVETPYDSIKIMVNTKDREVLTTVRNNGFRKRCFVRLESITGKSLIRSTK